MDRKIKYAEYQKLQKEAALSRERNNEIRRLNKQIKGLNFCLERLGIECNTYQKEVAALNNTSFRLRDVIFEPFVWPRSKIKQLKQIING